MAGIFQGLAITFVSDEGDAKILNDVQERFDVNITELPEEIDLASYSRFQILLTYKFFIIFSDIKLKIDVFLQLKDDKKNH